jgi:hypothetical protein
VAGFVAGAPALLPEVRGVDGVAIVDNFLESVG